MITTLFPESILTLQIDPYLSPNFFRARGQFPLFTVSKCPIKGNPYGPGGNLCGILVFLHQKAVNRKSTKKMDTTTIIVTLPGNRHWDGQLSTVNWSSVSIHPDIKVQVQYYYLLFLSFSDLLLFPESLWQYNINTMRARAKIIVRRTILRLKPTFHSLFIAQMLLRSSSVVLIIIIILSVGREQ